MPAEHDLTNPRGPRSVTCPHCGERFELEDGAYYDILSQVRDAAFRADLEARTSGIRAEHEAELRRVAAENSAALVKVRNEAQAAVSAKDRELSALRADFETRLRIKDEEVAAYRDFKARQSTKAIGESLEQYCSDAFDKVRAMAFPGAYFEKDNAVSRETGSKGDFIFRDFAPDGTELVSVMFEMKNEADGTDVKSRHKNADFFKELDKDRREKNCEYAVLVTLLEPDSELYNQGIVDVCHRYPKMYVIRPQFFIPVIGFLRNAAAQRVGLQAELARARAEHADLAGLEADVEDFKARFGRNHRIAGEKLDAAVAEIDKAIKSLEKTKAALLSSQSNWKYAGDKLENLSVKRLAARYPAAGTLDNT